MSNLQENLTDRQTGIDLLECIAIFLVIMYHGTLYASNILEEASALRFGRYLFRTLLSPCVPLFFFANGYLLFSRELNLKKHLIKTMKLIVLAGVWGLGKIFILMPIKKEYLSFLEIVKTLWSWKEGWINSLWFLGALVCIYILFPLLKLAYDTNKQVFGYFIVSCAVLTFGNVLLNECGTAFLTLVLHKNITLEGLNFFNIFNPFRGMHGYSLVYFCVGGYAYQYKSRLESVKPAKRNTICITAMAACCVLLWGVGICYSKASNTMWDIVWNGYDTVFTFVNVLCIFVLCLGHTRDSKLIRTISCNTLGIYFLHEIFIQLTKKKILTYAVLCNIPCNLIYSLFILFGSLIITLLMKKTPILKYLVS